MQIKTLTLFARRSIEPEITHHFQDLVASARVIRVHLRLAGVAKKLLKLAIC